ncbi:MAG: cation:proton antiporter [Chloroflexota bacterium]
MNNLLTLVAIIIVLNSFLCLYRAVSGPTIQDRILGINIVGTKTLTLLVLVSFIFKSNLYLDVAMVYALLNFVVTVAASRYLETGSDERNNYDS